MASIPLHRSLCSSRKARESDPKFQKSHSLLLRRRPAPKVPSATPAIESPLCTPGNPNACRMFEELRQRDSGNNQETLKSLCTMLSEGIHPNGFTISAGLRTCLISSDLNFGQQLHGQAIKMQLLSDLFVGSGLVDLYAKCGETEQAETAFLSLPRRNTVSFNALLDGYARKGDESKAVELFRRIDHSARLDKFTLSIVLKCCAGLGDVRKGRELHSLMVRTGLELDGVLTSNLIEIYAKSGSSAEAFRIFHQAEHTDVVVWTSMIACLDKQGLSGEAKKLFRSMVAMGVRPNRFTLASAVSAGADSGDRRFCASVHAHVIKCGFELELGVSNAIMDMYMRSGDVEDGCLLFDGMEEHDIISWNGILSGFREGDNCGLGLRIFRRMLVEGLTPNMYSFISVLRSCTRLREGSYGRQIHNLILKSSLGEDCFVGTALIDMYASCGSLCQACQVLERMKRRDVFCWTVIISGQVKEGRGEDGIKFYRRMVREGVRPNEFTLASCLKACSDLTSLDTGRQFHSAAIKSGLGDAFVTSSLVEFYLKCGSLSDGETAFALSHRRDLVSWNTIIIGYSQHGFPKKALNSFKQMLEDGLRPDQVTFIAVLSACSHAGLLEEGKHHFESMIRSYEITPTVEHYACMISLLGRAGKLNEVELFIANMEIATNAIIWQTVLAACRIHKNTELGERAAENLFKLEPQMDSGYVLLSNIYADLEMWDDVARIRAAMSGNGVKKEPGCSWIQSNGEVNVFLSQDDSHPMFEETHLMLNVLTQDMMVSPRNNQEELTAEGGG